MMILCWKLREGRCQRCLRRTNQKAVCATFQQQQKQSSPRKPEEEDFLLPTPYNNTYVRSVGIGNVRHRRRRNATRNSEVLLILLKILPKIYENQFVGCSWKHLLFIIKKRSRCGRYVQQTEDTAHSYSDSLWQKQVSSLLCISMHISTLYSNRQYAIGITLLYCLYLQIRQNIWIGDRYTYYSIFVNQSSESVCIDSAGYRHTQKERI